MIWDINNEKDPVCRLKCPATVMDASWAEQQLAVASTNLQLWDLRKPWCPAASVVQTGHALEFHKNGLLFAVAAPKDALVYDVRKVQMPVATLSCGEDEVHSVSWAPWNPTVLAASGADGRCRLFDLGRNNREEPFFTHGGHRQAISELAWAQTGRMLATTDDNNELHMWTFAAPCYFGNEAEKLPGRKRSRSPRRKIAKLGNLGKRT